MRSHADATNDYPAEHADYLVEATACRAHLGGRVVNGDACIVQFPHPGGEHTSRTDVKPWNQAKWHRRKFLRNHGSTVNPDGVRVSEGELVFWGEWEPPSTIERRWLPQPGLPTLLHVPYWSAPGPVGRRQNTDPWVFGPTFLYSNCKQLNASGTASAMQRLPSGSLILFGSTRGSKFVLDTVFVVARAIAQYRPIERPQIGSDAFNVCTVDSLAAGATRSSESVLTLTAGATPQEPINGMFSFVPSRPWTGDDSRFARPAICLPDIINPHSRQSPHGAKELRPQAQIADAWNSIVAQVTTKGLELGVDLVEPPLVI